jgi:hypothetical protein
MTKEQDKSLNILRKLAVLYPNDPNVKQRIQMLEQMSKPSAAPTPGKEK